jgi:hypothetical protein
MGMPAELEEEGVLDDFSMLDQSEDAGESGENENDESLVADSADSEIIEIEDTSLQ